MFPQVVNTTPGTNPKPTPHNLFFPPVLHHAKRKTQLLCTALRLRRRLGLAPSTQSRMQEARTTRGGVRARRLWLTHAPSPGETAGDRHLPDRRRGWATHGLATPARPFPVGEGARGRPPAGAPEERGGDGDAAGPGRQARSPPQDPPGSAAARGAPCSARSPRSPWAGPRTGPTPREGCTTSCGACRSGRRTGWGTSG